ncbi:MAG: BMP family ABC transporter substrate-binding protein [Candidatus Heimdallarchaeota archaeon]|nr:BMP family ABC transporter substrate-binding protein [Candidatus Heimdallarchaeota archaeon]
MRNNATKYIILLSLVLSYFTFNPTSSSSSANIQNIALIVDASEFYDEDFVQDIINGFSVVNETFNINFSIFILEDYTFYNRFPYKSGYYFRNLVTNQTILAIDVLDTNDYDLIVLMGYELRRGFGSLSSGSRVFLPNLYPDTTFLFYDLAGEIPSYFGDSAKYDNVILVSFSENEIGFIAGTLATAFISPFPEKIALVGTYFSDPKSTALIAGFQAAIFREISDIEIQISYVDNGNNWFNYSSARSLSEELESADYGLIFSAVPNNNTLGIIDGCSTNIPIITIDSNRSGLYSNVYSIVKNNTQTILSLFNVLNGTEFTGAIFTYTFEDNVFYPVNWGNPDLLNQTMTDLYQDIVVDKIEIPRTLNYAQNTSGFEFPSMIILTLVLIPFISAKKRKR